MLAGSLVGSNGVFLRALYAAGIKGYYDGLAVHFYTLTLGSLRAIHETQLANGDNTAAVAGRVRLEQLLAAAEDPTGTGDASPRRCRRPTSPTSSARLARTPYVAAAVLYKLQDSAHENFGVLNTARRAASRHSRRSPACSPTPSPAPAA